MLPADIARFRSRYYLALASIAGVAIATYVLYRWRSVGKRMRRVRKQDAVVIETVEDLQATGLKITADTMQFKVIGLDCEWCSEANGSRRPVALLQLATVSGYSALIRLCKLDGCPLPQELRDLLADSSILKVGVAVLDDAHRLLADHHLLTQGCLDLRHLAQRHMPRELHPAFTGGLANLAELFLHQTLDKPQHVRCGDWESETLSDSQVRYGANDALVALDIFLAIIQLKVSVPREFDEKFWCGARVLCQGLMDVKYKYQPGGERRANTNSPGIDRQPPHSPRKSSSAYKARRTQMYHNCRLIAPDGVMLCTCHRQKAEWYVTKGIGKVDCQEPFTVRLLFEPTGMSGTERAYYLEEKANQCVVCGREDSYIRKNIVPHEYRRNFPEIRKKHSSHDVLLLCLSCHQVSSSYDRVIRQQLTREYKAPIDNATNSHFMDDREKTRARSAAKALDRNRAQLPQARVEELERILMDYLGVEVGNLTTEVIQETTRIDVRSENKNYQGSHGDKVVGMIMRETDGIERFERRWRQHFLETMRPNHMPALWSVHHRHKAVEGQGD